MTDTTSTLTSDLNPSQFGDTVTFSVSVVSNDGGVPGPPTGSVEFFDGATSLGTRPVDGSGNASYHISTLSVIASPHVITGVYSGDSTFNPSTSNSVSQVVNFVSTVITLSSSTNFAAIIPGQTGPGTSVVFTATITNGSAATGDVTFKLGADVIGTAPLVSGQANLPLNYSDSPIPSLSPIGPNTVTADYPGDDEFSPASDTQPQFIGYQSFITFGYPLLPIYISDPPTMHQSQSVVDGQTVTLVAAVALAAGFGNAAIIAGATGVMTFKEGSAVLGISSVDPASSKSVITLLLPLGTHSIQAEYSGGGLFYQGGTDGEVSRFALVVVTPASGGGGPNPPPPPRPPDAPPLPPTNRFVCDQRIDCPGTDSPVLNLSSEAIDFPGFFSMYFGSVDPGMGQTWSVTTCVGVAESVNSQQEADILAALESQLCIANPDTTFWNTDQSCSYSCFDGTSNTFTTPAHSFQASTQEIADSLAHSYACLQATAASSCFATFSNTSQTCSYTCPNDSSVTNYTAVAGMFQASSQEGANTLANQYACIQAQINSGCVLGFGNTEQSCSLACPNGLTSSFTTPANLIYSATQEAADALAHQYACLSAQMACSTLFDNDPQACTYTCPNDSSTTNFTTPASAFKALSKPAANTAAQQYACLSAQLIAGCAFGFGNTLQTCVYTCPNGPSSTYTVPANTFYADTQVDADALAHQYACLAAQLQSTCAVVFHNHAQTCTFNCQTGQSFTYTTPAGMFSSNTQESADQLANEFACLEAMFQAFQDPNCGNQPPNCPHPPCVNIPVFLSQSQSCSVPCADGLEFVFTVRPGQFAASSQLLADRMAYTYACRQAQLNSVCLSALSVSAVCMGTENVTIIITAIGVTSAPINLWELIAGSVPPGMMFNGGFAGNSITISGTPSAAGNFSFTVKVTETNGNFMSKSYQFCVTELLPSTLADAPVNTPYSQNITLNCGGTPSAWFVTSGTLPPGITLDSENGTLQGTPTVVGAYSFTIQAQLA